MKLVQLILGSVIALASASGAPLIFYGFDLGLGELTPLAAFPNSSAQETAFKASLAASETETFESFGKGTTAPLNLTFDGVTAIITGAGSINSVPVGTTNEKGRYGVSPTKFWDTSTESFKINFSDPVIGFGFYGIDVGDFNGDLIITVGDVKYDLNTANRPGGSVLFWGIIDVENPFSQVSFSNTNFGRDFFGFDNMTVSTDGIVPEPSTFMLMAGGAALAALARRLRR